MGRFQTAAAALLVVGGIIAGCGATSSAPRRDPGGTPSAVSEAGRRNARVVGTAQLCGGPMPGRCFSQPTVVSVLDAGGRTVVRRQTGRDGRFSVELAPGDYTLSLDSFGATGTWGVNARAGVSVRIDPVIPIP